VQLAPRPVPPSARAQPLPMQPQRPPTARAERARPLPRSQKSPPTIVLNTPTPSVPAVPAARPTPPAPPAAPAAAPARTPADGDLASYVEGRRRQRAESASSAAAEPPSVAQPGEDDNARANRIAAANLGLDRKPTFGSDTSRGGGIFSIQRMSYDYAEFLFFGWNKDIRRNTTQTIEVRKGGNSDIRVAVVRRMIGIIREYEEGDFVWESRRLGRNVTLSARARDTAGLEDFMMREFFGDGSRP
jgi:hypothetical protein